MIWRMWEAYREVVRKYPRLPLKKERRLIALTQAGRQESSDELVLRHLGSLMMMRGFSGLETLKVFVK